MPAALAAGPLGIAFADRCSLAPDLRCL